MKQSEKIMRKNSVQRAAFVTAAAALASSASAIPIYWDGTGTAWGTVSAWSTDSAATTPDPLAVPGSGDAVIFNIDGLNAALSVGLSGANQAANSILFRNTSTTNIGGGGNRDLLIGDGGGTLASGAGAATIGSSTNGSNVFVRFTADQTWTNNSASLLRVSNAATATATGATPVTLTVRNTSTGNTQFDNTLGNGAQGAVLTVVIDAGSGSVSHAGGTYSGGLTVKSGTLNSSGSGSTPFGASTGAIVLGDSTGTANAAINVNRNGFTFNIGNNISVVNNGAGSTTIGASSNTTANLTGTLSLDDNVTISPSLAATVDGVVSGNGSITKASGGTLALNNANTYSGGTTIVSGGGTLRINNGGTSAANSAIGTGTLTISGGFIDNTSGGAITLATNNAQTWNAQVNFTGTNSLNLGTGAVSLGTAAGTSRVVSVSANKLTVGGVISDGTTAKAINKQGVGTLALTGLNTYTSFTQIGPSGQIGGVLEVTHLKDGGLPSSIGQSSNSSGNLAFGGVTAPGTLRYVGADNTTTNRLFVIGGIGAVLENSGVGTVAFTNTGSPSYGSSNVATSLTLGGTNAGNNVYALKQNNNGSGAVSLIKNGTGTWVLTNSNTYTGATTVNGGKLVVGDGVNGSIGNSAVTVGDTATLGGSGSIGGSVTVNSGGTIAPGNSPGILSTGSVVLVSGANLAAELNGASLTPSVGYDQLNVTGTVDLGGATLAATLGYAPTGGDSLFIVNNDGTDAVTGTFAGLPTSGSVVSLDFSSTTYLFTISYVGDFATQSTTGGNDVVLTAVVPEPTMLGVLALAAGGLLRRRRVA